MSRIPNIDLSRQVLEDIIVTESFNRGGEAIVCCSDKPNTLYKIFIDPYTGEIVDMSDNKFKKIAALHQMQLEHSVKPLSTISMDGQLVGYEMTYNREHIPLATARLDRNSAIAILKKVKTGLEHFHTKKTVYGDVTDRNVLINKRTGEIEFCDMDNVQQGENPIDVMGKQLRLFCTGYGTVDAVADTFMFNLLTLQQVGFPTKHSSYDDIMLALEQGQLPSNFDRKAIKTIESMTNPATFNGQYAIKGLKR